MTGVKRNHISAAQSRYWPKAYANWLKELPIEQGFCEQIFLVQYFT
jgi:hypothetical protein